MLQALKRSVVFWVFGLLLFTSIVSLVEDSFAKPSFHGSDKIKIAENFAGTAPLETCLDISQRVLDRFSGFLGNFESLIIHTDTSKRRGLSNGELIYMRCLDDPVEFEHVLIHEIGHVVDLTYLEGSDEAEDSSFDDFGDPVKVDDVSSVYYSISWDDTDSMSDTSSMSHFASQYAATNPFEDFAETFLMYVEHGDLFRYLAFKEGNTTLAKKYIFMKTKVFDGKEFKVGHSLGLKALRLLKNEYSPVFDMTKMYNLV